MDGEASGKTGSGPSVMAGRIPAIFKLADEARMARTRPTGFTQV
jgi:hypothetical protein